MAIWDLRPKTDLVTGVAVGVGVIAVPVVLPLIWSVMRPVLKAVLKSGFMLYETGHGVLGFETEGSDREKPKETATTDVRSLRAQARPPGEKKPVAGSKTGAAKAKKSGPTGKAKDRGSQARGKPKNETEKVTKEIEKDHN